MKKLLLIILLNITLTSPFFSQINDSLVAHFLLDGNGVDNVGSNNGTVIGAIPVSDRNGNTNSAYQFDGINDMVDIGSYPDLAITGDITVSSWVKTPTSWQSVYADPMIYVRNTVYVTNVTGVNLYINNAHLSTRKFGFILRTATNTWGDDFALSTSTLQLNTWYFVVGVREGNLVKIYVNGVLEKTDAGTGGLIDYGTSPSASIGQKDGTSQHWFKGTIDDVRIYKRALTLSDIQTLYNWTGINETFNNSESQIILYPNPTTNYLNISIKENNFIHKIEIFDIAGKVTEVKSFKKSDEVIEIDISKLADGVYFLKIYDKDNITETSKFLKSK